MNFEALKEKIDSLNCESIEELKYIEENIDITPENFDVWVDDVFSDKVLELDLDKLPYVIDTLYKTNDKLKFMLCCMLIESTCVELPFITNLENYILFEEKYKTLKNTLITVYESVDNGIANCMALIMLNNDPGFELLDDSEKVRLITATNRKLKDIIEYIQNCEDIDELVYRDLEIIIDLATYMEGVGTEQFIEELSTLPLDFDCKLFIAKYKAVHGMEMAQSELDQFIENKKELYRTVSVFEKIGALDKLPLDRIRQEEVAESHMIDWLKYPTELGEAPDEIVLLGEFAFEGQICYAFKFRSDNFRIQDFMLGITGGYEKNKITSNSTGLTFSKFEVLEDDFMQQAKELAAFINGYWKSRQQ